MTTYEHFMLTFTFSCMLVWVLAGYYFIFRGIFCFIKDKVKAIREKKLSGITDNNM